jgi:hypothetical protein
MRSTLMLLVLGATLTACGADPADPTDPPKTSSPGDKLSPILSTPGASKDCLDEIPAPTVEQQATADNPCPDSGSACVNTFAGWYRWCKADGAPAIGMCEKGAWVLKAKKCP